MWDGTNASLHRDSSKNYMYGNFVYILDEITSDNCAYLIGDLSTYVMDKDNINKDKILTFIINSPGGEVYTMMTIIGLINIAKLNRIKIQTIVLGLAASAASVIAIQGDIRRISNISRHLIHFGSCFDVTTKRSEIEKIYKQNVDYSNRINDIYLQCCNNLTPKDLERLQADERGYLTAEECLKYGLADNIIEDDLSLAYKLDKDTTQFNDLFMLYQNKQYKKLNQAFNKLIDSGKDSQC